MPPLTGAVQHDQHLPVSYFLPPEVEFSGLVGYTSRMVHLLVWKGWIQETPAELQLSGVSFFLGIKKPAEAGLVGSGQELLARVCEEPLLKARGLLFGHEHMLSQ